MKDKKKNVRGDDARFGSIKYNKNSTPELLVKTLSEGNSNAAFCAVANIGQRTFYKWVNKHPEFAEAYDIGKMKQQKRHEDLARNNIIMHDEDGKFNTVLWSIMARNMHNYTEHRKVKINGLDKAKTPTEQLGKVMDAMSNGELTSREAKDMASFIEVGVNIIEKTDLMQRVAAIEIAMGSGVKDEDFKEES